MDLNSSEPFAEDSRREPPPLAPSPGEPGSAEVHRHRWGLGAFLLAQAVLLLSSVFLSALFSQVFPDQAALAIVVVTAVPTILAAFVAIIATVYRGNGPFIDLRLRPCRPDIAAGVKYGLVGLVITCAAAVIWARAVGQQNATSTLAAIIDNRPLPVNLAIVLFLYAWLVGPLCEEIIYRGLLWGALERLGWGRWSSFAICTAVFAIGHLEPDRTLLLLVISISISYSRLVTGRLPASVIAHQINNFLPALSILLLSFGIWV